MKTSPEVDRWFAEKKPAAAPALQRVRQTILGADDRMTERVQYGTITFACGDSMASFVQVAKKDVTLMFNRGSSSRTRRSTRISRAPARTRGSCGSPVSPRSAPGPPSSAT